MLKPGRNSDKNFENISEILCEQYLPRVFRYVNCWVNDTEIAEEVTLKVLKKALAGCGNCYRDENRFTLGIFTAAHNEIQQCFERGTIKPILHGLSAQELEVISLRLGARLNNQIISKLIGLSESKIGTIVHRSLCKLNNFLEVPV